MTGVVCVLVAALALGGGHRGRPPVGPQSGGGPADGPLPSAPALGDLLQRVFSATDEGLVVVDRSGDVVLANERARELGVVVDDKPDARAVAACAEVRERGTAVAVDLSPLDQRGRRPAAVLGAACGRSATATRWSRRPTRPTRSGWRPPGATSWPTSATSSRRPVGAIGLLAEAVLDAADDPAEVRRFGTKILSEANRLGTLVTELIALSRLTAPNGSPSCRASTSTRSCSEALGRTRLSAEAARHRDRRRPAERAGGRRRPDPAGHRAVQPARERDRLLARRDAGVGRAGGSGDSRRDRRDRPRHRHRPGAPASGSSSASSASTRPAPAPPAAPGWGWRSSSTSLANHGGEVRLWSRPGTGSTFTDAPPDGLAGRSADRAPVHRSEDRHDQGADRRGRGVLRRPARLPAAQGGLHHRRRRHRARTRWRSSTATAPTSCCSTSCCPA